MPTSKPTLDNRVRVRMYRHGLGDCFLLRFPKKDSYFHIVIDSGVLLGTKDSAARMIEVAEDIKQETGGEIDVLVVTHEHWDHVSGFSGRQARSVWDTIKFKAVWLAWTEDPKDVLANKLREDRELGMTTLRAGLQSAGAALQMDAQAASRINELLAFNGWQLDSLAASGTGESGTTEAMNYVRKLVDAPTFLKPGDIQKLSGVTGVRVFVLGPPHDEKKIKKSDPSMAHPEVYEELDHGFAVRSLDSNSGDEAAPPFSTDMQIGEASYADVASWNSDSELNPQQSKELQTAVLSYARDAQRKLSAVSLSELENMAIALDGNTNNSSLVLAFELAPQGRVLLFAADAQVGNWLSWQEVTWKGASGVTAKSLMEKAVLYKVGHHGSHNATLKDLGLELMTNKNLMAVIPVNQAMAQKKKWSMPFPPLWDRLKEKTRGRVMLSDSDAALPDDAALSHLTATERKRFKQNVVASDIAIDIFF
jgi:beta-lactamase superfamily II metal-dependent hydrolase